MHLLRWCNVISGEMYPVYSVGVLHKASRQETMIDLKAKAGIYDARAVLQVWLNVNVCHIINGQRLNVSELARIPNEALRAAQHLFSCRSAVWTSHGITGNYAVTISEWFGTNFQISFKGDDCLLH